MRYNMSRTYRRKNAYNKVKYVEDWFNHYEHETNPINMKNDNSLRNVIIRKNWYHSDNYKPIATSGLKLLKELSKKEYKAKHKNNLKRIKFLNDYDDFADCNYNYYKNPIKYCIF